MFDFNDSAQIGRLYDAFYASRSRMSVFQENRFAALQQYVGRHFSENGTPEKMPLPMIQQYVDIYSRLLVPQDPMVWVTTRFDGLKAQAANMEVYMNERCKEMRVGEKFRRWIKDAFFCMGILIIGIEAAESFQWDGQTYYYGEPLIDNVDFDDYLVDMAANRWSAIEYEGHLYSVPLEAARNDPELDGRDQNGELRREQLRSGYMPTMNESGADRARMIELDYNRMNEQDFRDKVWLWQIFMHREQKLVTVEYVPGQGFTGMPLRVRDWHGPRSGPYKRLWFNDIPGMLMPMPPVAARMDMHELANTIMVKLGRDAVNHKSVLLVDKGAAKDARKVMSAKAGEVVAVDNPEDFTEVKFRGIDQTQLAFLMQVYSMYSRDAGNLETVGGLSTQAATATQEKLLAEQAGTQTKDMQATTIARIREVYEDLGWYYWTEPLRDYQGERRIDGVEVPLPFTIRPEDRDGNVYKLNFSVNLYSFVAKTPVEELAQLDQFVQQIILPLMPLIQQQGGVFKTEEYLRVRAKLSNSPYMNNLVAYEMPTVPPDEPLGEVPKRGPKPPPPVERFVTRRPQVAAGPGRDMQNMAELLRAGQPQNGEMNGVAQ